jgi:hypothetical protein
MTMFPIMNPRDFVVDPVPVSGPQDRMDRLATLDAEQMNLALSFLIGFAPQVFDAVLDAAEPCAGNLVDPDEAEPFCTQCGATIGIFLRDGLHWQHYAGDGTTAGQQQVYDPGHPPVPSWRLAEDGLVIAC